MATHTISTLVNVPIDRFGAASIGNRRMAAAPSPMATERPQKIQTYQPQRALMIRIGGSHFIAFGIQDHPATPPKHQAGQI